TSAPAVTYSVTGGTITSGGLYTAGSTAGTFRVIAAQTGATLADTSVVSITSGTITSGQNPLPSGTILLDTRRGGAQDIQAVGVTTFATALSLLVQPRGGEASGDWGFTTDLDGAG